MEEYNKCLVVSRHRLLPIQEEDVEKICNDIYLTHELETDVNELKAHIRDFDAIIGILPLPIQVQILQNGKKPIVFAMRSIGVMENEEDANIIASKYEGRAVVLPPSKEGEKYSITLYEGLKVIKEIKIGDEWLIQHQS